MMVKYITFLSALLLASIPNWAAEPYQPTHPDPVLESWRWRVYPELKSLVVRCMVEDREGNLWFGLDEGVRRFDGINWTTYLPEKGLHHREVNDLLIARNGTLYAATEAAIYRFDSEDWHRVYPPDGDFLFHINGLIESSDGSLWAATKGGALHLKQGFKYTTCAIQPDGTVTSESYHNPAPFPTVIRQTIERFIEGEPWKALIGETNAILEVPASKYGRLRITSSERQDFTKEDIDSLQDFASAIALGYARYLDIREIQEQTQRKSAFLASMSHELRTPMNAIKGFTNLVLRREKDLSDRNRENLKKVTQASDHLLAMIKCPMNYNCHSVKNRNSSTWTC